MPLSIANAVRFPLAFLCAFLFASALFGCEAYDLGDEEAAPIAVNASSPTWNNGIREVVEKRCDNCHAKGERPFAPSNVASFKSGFSESEETFQATWAAASLARVKNTSNPMPPSYADPLFEEEKTALVSYLEAIVAKSNPFATCEKTTTALTFASDIKTITDANCKGCHPGVNATPLLTAADFKAKRSAVFEYLSGKRSEPMPPGDDAFASSADGKALVEWICGSPEVK